MIRKFLTVFMLCVMGTGILHCQEGNAQESNCGLLDCHGVEPACGFNAPQVCDAMYRLGDFCRQYISCQVVGGECRAVTEAPFEQCRACVLECEQIKDDPARAFACESSCREQLGG